MLPENLRYKSRSSILSIPSGIFDMIIDVLDTGPPTKNWRSFVDLASREFRLSQLEIEKIRNSSAIQGGSSARQALYKLETLGLTVGHLVYYLDALKLENLLVYFKFYEPLRIESAPPPTIQVHEGGALHLIVHATGFPYPRFQWFIGNTVIDRATESSLIIKNITLKNEGSYCCRLHNSSDLGLCLFTDPSEVTVLPAQDRSTLTSVLTSRDLGNTVRVDDAQTGHMAPFTANSNSGYPLIVQHPASQFVESLASVTFTCVAEGSGVIKYRWIFDGRIIKDSFGSTLQIPNAQVSDEGSYECIVYNNYGHVTSNKAQLAIIYGTDAKKKDGVVPIRVDIIGHPKSTTVVNGGCAFYRCVAVGTPPLNYQWYKDSKLLSGEHNAELIVSDVSSATEGCYQCQVWNSDEEVLSCPAYLSVTETNIDSLGNQTYYTATDKVVLLIGNYDYQSAGPLKAPKTDVQVLSECFKSMDFKVVSLLNLTKSEMLAAVNEFCELLSDEKSCGSGVYTVFYFCGHGFQDKLKQCYLVPVDAHAIFAASECVCAEYILEQIQQTRPSLCCIILDCCRTVTHSSSDSPDDMYYPQPHGNTIFFYATTFGMKAFEYGRDESCITSKTFLPSEELNGILVKHLQSNLCKKQSVLSVFSKTQEEVGQAVKDISQKPVSDDHSPASSLKPTDIKLMQCQIPDLWSNLAEPRRSLADRIAYHGHTAAYSQRMLRWINVHKKPAKSQLRFDEIGVVVEVDYDSDFSNVLSVYLTVIDRGYTTECQPWVTKLPLNLDVMGHPRIVSFNPLTTKTTIQDLQKLQDIMMMTVGVYYRMDDVTSRLPQNTDYVSSGHLGKTLELGKPLVSVLDLWRVGKDIVCKPLYERPPESLASIATVTDTPSDMLEREMSP